MCAHVWGLHASHAEHLHPTGNLCRHAGEQVFMMTGPLRILGGAADSDGCTRH